MRHGEPIDVTALRTLEGQAGRARQDHPTTHYIWRTQSDGRVRPSHAANDGRVFAWDDPPPTGHPGEDYCCRCWAEPSVPDTAEVFNTEMQNVSDEGPAWGHQDFVRHYFHGEGHAVTVRETGHLKDVVDEFMRQAGAVPTRLPGQIADAARLKLGQSFKDTFENTYRMTGVVFSTGDTTIEGRFAGQSKLQHALLELHGIIHFKLKDEFKDPIDLGTIGVPSTELPYGMTYPITDRWTATFSAKILLDGRKSRFKKKEEQ